MAAQHRVRSPKEISFVLDHTEVEALPRATVRLYLRRLWRSQVAFISATGYIDLNVVVIRANAHAGIAMGILFDALADPGTDFGVATKLKSRLDVEASRYAHTMAPEHIMLRKFTNLARILHAFSGHQELKYAMSEWFTIYAAETVLSGDTLFEYVLALDDLEVDMTGPLHALLRRTRISPSVWQSIQHSRRLRPKTSRKLFYLVKDQQKKTQSARHVEGGLITGGDLRPEDIIEHWLNDPESVLIDLGAPKCHRHESEYGRRTPSLMIGDIHDDCRLHPYSDDCLHERWCPDRYPVHGPHSPYSTPPRIPSPIPWRPAGSRPLMSRSITYPRLIYN
ncbi:MAG: hypothetical protein Q9218_001914 [Villophora microphyllina]